MRLIGYGPGEIVDRISILSLKIQQGRLTFRDVTHYQAERDALLVELRYEHLKKASADQVFELAAVNAVIWQLTDTVRAERVARGKNDSNAILAECAVRLQIANDDRAKLISLINLNSGHEEKGPEKL